MLHNCGESFNRALDIVDLTRCEGRGISVVARGATLMRTLISATQGPTGGGGESNFDNLLSAAIFGGDYDRSSRLSLSNANWIMA